MIDSRLFVILAVNAIALIGPSIMRGEVVGSIPAFILAAVFSLGFCFGYAEGRDELAGYLWENDLVREPEDTSKNG